MFPYLHDYGLLQFLCIDWSPERNTLSTKTLRPYSHCIVALQSISGVRICI